MLKKITPWLLAAVPGLFDRGLALSDYHSVPLTIFCWMLSILIIGVAATVSAREWHKKQVGRGRTGVNSWQIAILIGLCGTWFFLSVLFVAVGFPLLKGAGVGFAPLEERSDNRPLRWYDDGLEFDGGPLQQTNVFHLRFRGRNVSQREVRLKSASIRSARTGAELSLQVMVGEHTVDVEAVNLIPPGAPIKLEATFNPPKGLSPQDFLATWSRFYLVIADDSNEYRLPFNEGNIQLFFPGLVGPNVTLKTK